MGGVGVGFLPNFQKGGAVEGGGGLDRISIFRGELLGKRGLIFFRKGCSFYLKNKLESEIFNDKNSL